MLETIDLSLSLDRASYVREVTRREVQLRELGYQVYVQKRPVVLAFEGWDAAGKGGAIKRVTEKLDPRGYVVYPISAPQGEDKKHHYLYRFWQKLPLPGTLAIFDRTWYGRVLVERVEDLIAKSDWQRAYDEINEFEAMLVDDGVRLVSEQRQRIARLAGGGRHDLTLHEAMLQTMVDLLAQMTRHRDEIEAELNRSDRALIRASRSPSPSPGSTSNGSGPPK